MWEIFSHSTDASCTADEVVSSCHSNLTLILTGGGVWSWGTMYQLVLGEIMTPAAIVFSEPFVMVLKSGSGQLAEVSTDQRIKYQSSLVKTLVTVDTFAANTLSTLSVTFESKIDINLRCLDLV